MQSSSSTSAASSSGAVLSIIKRTLNLTALVLRILLWPLLKLTSILFPAREFDGLTNPRVSDASARAFVSFFQNNYLPASNDNPNPFEPVGYNSCVSDATRQNKCVLIYLHSPLHRDSHDFCQNVLATSAFQNVARSNQHILSTWGASIHTADGSNVAKSFHVTSYPFVALIACRQGRSSLELLLKMEGRAGVQELVACLSMSLYRHSAILNELEMRRLMREEEVRLRQEQDREYQEALLADQRRESEAERLQQEALAAQRAKEDEENRQVRQKERKLEDAKRMIPPEPPSTTPRSEMTHIRFTLPSGTRIDRRFRSDDSIQIVRAFLFVYFNEKNITIEKFSISTNYPKKTFTEEDNELSLSEAGLVPQAVIMIQDLDA